MIQTSNRVDFSIRKAVHADLKILNHIYYHSKGYWNYSKEFLDNYLAIYKLDEAYLDHNEVWLLIMNTIIIGYYGFVFEADNIFELDHFFLLPQYIGKGYGRVLWNFACKTAKACDKKEFLLCTEPGAESFYAKMGCKKIGMNASELLDEEPSATMIYRLQ